MGASVIGALKTPRSLRPHIISKLKSEALESSATRKVAVGCLIAVASITSAEAQQQPPAPAAAAGAQPLPPVTVPAPTVRKKPVTAKPTAEQLRIRNALRRAARAKQRAAAARAAAPSPTAAAQTPDRDPYADPAAPYKGDRLASPKFSEPIVNTPKSITVLTREILQDKDATSLKDVARTTAGITLGTGEGGNAFGDRFFIRGFDARNDVFVDGIRDPAVNIRENFFTEQIEILKGPSSTIDGRGTTGGALNIVTKQATDKNFYNAESTLAGDGTRRITFDVNQVVSPTLAVRMDGLWQNAGVAGRDFTTDDREGGAAAIKWTPTRDFTLTASYVHTYLWGLPDFGVPYDTVAGGPVTMFGVPRNTFYGFVNRDFQVAQQDIGTVNGEYRVNDFITISNKFRDEQSVLNYIGTIPEQGTGSNGSCNSMGGNFSSGNPANWLVCLNPLSRYQTTDVTADQSAATIKFDTGPVTNTVVSGVEFSRERVSIDTYNGLNSEAIGAGAFASGTVGPVSVLSPPNGLPFGTTPTLTGNPNVIPIYSKSAYALETANFHDLVILNGGVRFDDYNVSASKIGFPTVSSQSDMWNYNVGAVFKPVPIGSLYVAYGTGSEPVGAELDGTSANYGGLNPTSPINQIFSPIESKAEEVGTKWELFERHLLVTGALFRTDVTNARELVPAGLSQCRHRASRRRLPCRGHRPRRRRQDHGQVERLHRARADAKQGRSVSGSNQCRPAARLRRQSILQRAHQISNHRRHPGRRPSHLPLENLWRHPVGCEPGHRSSELLAIRYVRQRQSRQELAMEGVRQQRLQPDILRRLLSKRGAIHSGGARTRGRRRDGGEVLNLILI